MSRTAGVPGNVPVLMLIGMKVGGEPLIGLAVEFGTPSFELLIFAMAPCIQACICVLPLEFVVVVVVGCPAALFGVLSGRTAHKRVGISLNHILTRDKAKPNSKDNQLYLLITYAEKLSWTIR